MARASDRFRHSFPALLLALATTLNSVGSAAQEARSIPVAVAPAVEQSVRRALKLAGTVTATR